MSCLIELCKSGSHNSSFGPLCLLDPDDEGDLNYLHVNVKNEPSAQTNYFLIREKNIFIILTFVSNPVE